MPSENSKNSSQFIIECEISAIVLCWWY